MMPFRLRGRPFFSCVKLVSLEVRHRVGMAPLPRNRAGAGKKPAVRATASRAAAPEKDVRPTHVALVEPAKPTCPRRNPEGYSVNVPDENTCYNGEARG